MKTFGERLQHARTLAGLSPGKLSLLAGLTRTHVAQIECGNRRSIGAETAAALADVLGVSLDWLISAKGKPPSKARILAALTARLAAERRELLEEA